MSKIFISYSRKDKNFAKRLAADLESLGLAIWWDISGIKPGSEWPKEIQEALENSSCCLVVLSPDSVQSSWVRKEYTFAQSEKKQIIPLYYHPCKVPLSLTDLNYIDFTGNYLDGIEQLYDVFGVRNKLGRKIDADHVEIEKREKLLSERQAVIFAEVKEIIADLFDVDENKITPESRLREDLNLKD